jgi:hypothetical protein
MTKVLREANSPGRDKENLGLLSGSCQIPRSQALDRICNWWKAPSARGRQAEKGMGCNKGGRHGKLGARVQTVTCPPELSGQWQGLGSLQERMPKGFLPRGGIGTGPPRGAVSELC